MPPTQSPLSKISDQHKLCLQFLNVGLSLAASNLVAWRWARRQDVQGAPMILRFALLFSFLLSLAPLIAPRWSGNPSLTLMGLPVHYIFSFAPILCIFLLLIMIAMRLAAISRFMLIVGGAGLLIFLLCIPFVFNQIVERRAAELLAADIREFTRPSAIRTLAVSRLGEPKCDDFCQKMLLNKQVERLLYTSAADYSPVVVDGAAATSFRMERRDSCPAVNLALSTGEVSRVSDKRADKEPTSAELMRAAMAGGNCLIVEAAKLGEADVVLFRRTVMNGPTSNLAASFGLNATQAMGDLLAMHIRDGRSFRQVYRRTIVTGDMLKFMSFFPLSFDRFVQQPILQLVTKHFSDGPDWNVFVTEMLGFDLTLKRGA